MKCPICGSEMRVILYWPSPLEERGYICECCDLIGDKKKIAYQQKLVAAKELAAEKRGAEKVIRALENSACQTRRFAIDVDIMSWGSGFETAIAVAKSALKAYEDVSK